MTTETQVEFIPQDRFDRREFRVGDVLWFSGKGGCPVEILQVGRKWVYINRGRPDYRFEKDGDMRIDGGKYISPGRLYANPDVCREHYRRWQLWNGLRREMGDRPNDSVTTDDILSAAKLLRLEIEP